ncbi:MAG: transglycosylase domain-containing protein [Thermoleophilaceae bacterium]
MSTKPRAPDSPVTEPGSASGNGHDPLLDLFAPAPEPGPAPEIRKRKPKLKKLRLFLVFTGVTILALISTVFGMMISVAGDLPSLENHAQLRVARNSILLPANGKDPIAKLTGTQNRILDDSGEISPNVKNSVIAIEDKRFYEHHGVDYRGIARAVIEDVLNKRAAQGASTITQQFVKNVLEAQGKRTVFEKLREAALAYHLERKWSKDKILTEYLNTVYFGNGAYGIESAARTYFGHGSAAAYDPNAVKAASTLAPWQAAYLAAMIASPSAYDPVQHPLASHTRMNLVLLRMLQQGMINRPQYQQNLNYWIVPKQVRPPRPDSRVPYYSSWVTQQLLDRYRSTGLVFGGGLEVTTSLDPDLQTAAEQAINGRLLGVGPSASLVAIDNRTGEVKAMVGGTDFERRPFNLATNGHRQPGSSFKPFTLVGALEDGISPGRTYVSAPKCFKVPHSPGEHFCVHNYENHYAGVNTITGATIASDNSIYAQLGIDDVGTNKIARVAHVMGVRTPLSRNPAMVLGGLKEGVTPLEMAYAYSTLANDGNRVWGTLGPTSRSPVAVVRVKDHDGHVRDQNTVRRTRVIPYGVAEQAKSILAQVIQQGTGKAAQIGEFAAGKTGTTENYGDAWFVGFNKELTVAVWVGYPDRLKPMLTEFHGQPVAGGTYPAEIWHDFMTAWIKLRDARQAARDLKNGKTPTTTTTTTGVVPTPAQTTPTQAQPAPQAQQKAAPKTRQPAPQKTPTQPPPQQQQQPPEQQQQQPPADGGGGATPPPQATGTG